MDDFSNEADREAIRRLIARQFKSLSWSDDEAPAWNDFLEDFLPDATLFSSARPVAPTSVHDFLDRMRSLAASSMPHFQERLLGAHVQMYGNIAVALAVCEQREGDAPPQLAVEAILLIKDIGGWHIAAQAWDKEREENSVPQNLLDPELPHSSGPG